MSAILQDNKIEGGHYAEPYAGGASLAISLLFGERVAEVHLNDFDRSVWAFWKSVIEHSNDLIERIKSTKVTIDEWYIQRDVQTRKEYASILDLGFSTFFLNRTNRSGILTGGVIGGKGQLGPWKIDARYNQQNLIDRLKRISAYKSRIHVTQLDALMFIESRSDVLPPRRSLIYLDPPYFCKGQELYMNAYKPEDHAIVAKAVTQQLELPWIVSYDDVPEIRQLYGSASRIDYVLRYSASTTRKGKEVIFLRPGLHVRHELLVKA